MVLSWRWVELVVVISFVVVWSAAPLYHHRPLCNHWCNAAEEADEPGLQVAFELPWAVSNYGFIMYTQVRMTKLLVMLSVANYMYQVRT